MNIEDITLLDYDVAARAILADEIEADADLIVKILELASFVYYNEDDTEQYPEISDAEYDALEARLRAINPNHPFLAEVGSDVRGGKIDLPVPMGSLDQVFAGDTLKWVRENGWENETFVISDKQDGTSALNVYGKGGLFARAYSRGNGFQGADISRHIKEMGCFVDKTSVPCMVREEVIIPDAVFEQWKKECEATGKRVYKNPRNYVAGRMNASESPKWFYDNVHIIATSVVEPKMGKLEQFKFLEENGFEVTPYRVVKGRELTDEFLLAYLTERREKSPTAIDGIVIDLDNPEIRAGLRRKSSSINPMYSKKFKVNSEEETVATVKNIHWQPSKHGYLKPRVEIEPIELDGVTVTYATGHNAKFIRDNKIGPGAKIHIVRSGQVIPYIVKTVSPMPL